MSNLTSTLTLQLIDDGLAKKAQADAEALKRLGASGADLKKLAASNPHIAKTVKHLDDLAARGSKLDAFRAGAKNLGELGRQMRLSRSEVAATAAAYAKAEGKGAKTAERAHKAALRRSETISDAWRTQAQAHRELRKSLLAEGVALGARGPGGGRGLAIGAAMKAVTAETEAANSALRRQVRLIGEAGQATQAAVARAGAAQRRAGPSMLGGMGAAGRAQLGDIEARRRVADGMGAGSRARAAAKAEAAEARAAKRQEGFDAGKALVGAGLLSVGHKAAEKRKEVLHTYEEFDDLIRYQEAVASLTPEEKRSRVQQSIHMGASTRFNDLQVLHAQLDLAQRGVKKEFIEPFVGEVANYAAAMNTDLGSAAKTLEGVIFTTNQDVEDPKTALKTMRKNVDQAVKMAKLGGLDDTDVSAAFKFGGPTGSGAGMSNPLMMGIFATLRRMGFAGAEAGVAVRAVGSKLVSPTSKGMDALTAMGINYRDYTTMPPDARPEVASGAFKRGFGKDMSKAQKVKLAALMDDPDRFGDMDTFVAEATEIASGSFDKGKNGKMKANDRKQVAKLFGTLWKNLVASVDSERLFHDIIEADPTLGQANAFFTDKHGGKIAALAKKKEVLFDTVNQLKNVKEGTAADMAGVRGAGYAGAAKRLAGARMNVTTAQGRVFDNGGEGNGGLLTDFTNKLANATQAVAELPGPVLAAGTSIAVLGGQLATLVGGSLLTGVTAGALQAAATGNGAAVLAGATAAAAVAAPVVATAAIGAALMAADKDMAIVHGGKDVVGRLDPSSELPGGGMLDGEKRKRTPSLPPGWGHDQDKSIGYLVAPNSAGAGSTAGVKSLIDKPATPQIEMGKVEELNNKLEGAAVKAAQLGSTQATPQISSGSLDSFITKLAKAIAMIGQLEGGVASANAGIASVNAGALRARSFSDGATPGAGAE